MVNLIRTAGLLALIPLIAAAPTAAEATEQNVPFSFEKWAEDIIANPNGQHPSPEEAIALAFNQTSSGSQHILGLLLSHAKDNQKLTVVIQMVLRDASKMSAAPSTTTTTLLL